MSKRDEIDQLLYKYMPIADEELIRELEQQIDEKFEFSTDFERRMENMIRKNRFRSKISTIGKFIRYAVAILIVSWGLCMAFSETVRSYSILIIKKIVTVFEDSFIHTYSVEGSKTEIILKEPAYVPEGYRCIDASQSDSSYCAVYMNDQGNQIIYQQMVIRDEMLIGLDSEYDYVKTVNFRGSELTLYLYKDGFINAYYSLDGYIFIISSETLNENDVFKMLNATIDEIYK